MTVPPSATRLWWTSCFDVDGTETWHWLCAHSGACSCLGVDRTMPSCGEEDGWSGNRHPTNELGPGDVYCEPCLEAARAFLAEQARPQLHRRTQTLADVWPAKSREVRGTADGPRSEDFAVAPSVRVDWTREAPGHLVIAFYDSTDEEQVGSILPRDEDLNGTDYLYRLPGRVFVHPVATSSWRLTITTLEGEPAALPFEADGFGLARTAPFEVAGLAFIETTGSIRGIHLLDPESGGSFEHLVPAIAGGPIPIVGDGGAYALMVTADGDWTIRVRAVDRHLRLAQA